MNYGEILKQCRERSGISQEELAFQLYMSQSDISKFENNGKEPTLSTVRLWLTATQSQAILLLLLCEVNELNMKEAMLYLKGAS